MPSQMPSSFAAAAGQGSIRDSRNGAKCEIRGNGDWTRKESKSAPNGTLTLRRSSINPISQNSVPGDPPIQPESLVSQQLTFEQNPDFRYTKKDFLDLFKRQNETGLEYDSNISHLYADGWAPGQSQGTNGRVGWGKKNDGRESYAPDICWDLLGDTQPISLEEMSEQEKKLFQGDINSHYKHSPQILKDSNINGRKSSFSHGQGSLNFNHLSPVSGRPSTRRQQTNDSTTTGITSPNGTNRFSRDEPSQAFTRKFDAKDKAEERPEDKTSLPFNGLVQPNTTASASGTNQVFPWPNSSSSTTSLMGAFGNFALSNTTSSTPGEKRSATSRAESRYFHSTPKEPLEDGSKLADRSWRPRQRTDTDPFADEASSCTNNTPGDDSGQLDQKLKGSDTPNRSSSGDLGTVDFSGFPAQSRHTPSLVNDQVEPMSPSDTNPYRSPPGASEEKKQPEIEGYESECHLQERIQGIGGMIENGQGAYGTIPRCFPGTSFDDSDRSQTSSATGTRVIPQLGGLPSLGTIGGLGGWPTASSSPMGITDRESRPNNLSAFGASIFGPMGEMPSSGPSNLTGIFGPTSNTSATTAPRGSKLGTLFPAAMQAQMQSTETELSMIDNETRQPVTFAAIARNSFTPSRDMESQMRPSRHVCEDLFQVDNPRSTSAFINPETSQVPAATFNNPQQNIQHSQASSDSSTNKQLPMAQQRMMVMPDRMRWLYLDPQAQVQGPFSGLEMHDWYKASFFTPDLSVKKLEDADFEPLGQLIRRIGNSREPFLVPQIGIPHGQPSTQTGAAFSPPAVGHGPGLAQSGTVQPPFANAFPSFGTTLTAEQQNNLERRKQEEQYLMARQREFLAQQQVNMKQMQMGGLPLALHHHSSLHNLQSQSSFGNISSPISVPPQPPLANTPSFFEGLSRQVSGSALPGDLYREDDITRTNLRDRHGQQVNPHIGHTETQSQAPKLEDIDFTARLQEFEQLREQSEIQDPTMKIPTSQKSRDSIDTPPNFQKLPRDLSFEESVILKNGDDSDLVAHNSLALSQCMPKVSAVKQTLPSPPQRESPWAKINSNLTLPFPPSQMKSTNSGSKSKIDRSNLSEPLNFEKKSESKPQEFISSPSVAPWVKDPIDVPKAVSLKAVTEAEAKKAAKAEEIAAANRRANFEQVLRSNTSQATVTPPGLPTTATWGSSTSPVHGTSVKSAWTKSVKKAQAPASKQKTLADIQREEELRKQKLAAAAVTQPIVTGPGNKRYADLAGMTSPNVASTGGPAWLTVGAGGKVKVPTGPVVSTQAPATRPASTQVITLPTRLNSKPNTSRNTSISGANNVNLARDELVKWAKVTLEKGLNPGINVNEFVTILNSFPSEPSIIADSIYSQSQTMNGNDFAVEFIRRRNNAEKGIIEPANSGSGFAFSTAGDKSGGWSEVAKKGPPKEETNTDFKFVPNKKKSKK